MAKPRYITFYGYFGRTTNVRDASVPLSSDAIARVLGAPAPRPRPRPRPGDAK